MKVLSGKRLELRQIVRGFSCDESAALGLNSVKAFNFPRICPRDIWVLDFLFLFFLK